MVALGRAYDDGAFARFDAFRDPEGFGALMGRVARLSWNVFAKAPFQKRPARAGLLRALRRFVGYLV